MRSRRLFFVTLVASAAFVACSGPGSSTPGSPTPSPGVSSAVTGVIVTGPTPTGATVQLTATAHFADGSTRDVTAISSWATSNDAVITVSPTGLATVVGAGSAEVRATYQNVVGRLAMQFAPGFALSGHVQEVGPSAPSLSDVRLAIVGGPGAGTAVSTDASGAFRFASISGVVDIEATKPGFLPWRLGNLKVDHNMTIDLTMYPTPPTNAAGQTATARCHDGTWSWAQTLADACAANGGILYGVCPGALCAATRSIGAIR